ncbi:type IV toxin-antitoxin system AbiEi family antitoxin [Flavobacterium psychrophilum]|uniref:type IV toxin-antitoxin system AbiEi family antitoxin domain-containing protein n=2 Tax=Flavobacterium psychrophilum TaxID=96345 RepID=UPI0009B7F32E|nr:type IV toxin-antitoxin system AbiEi family antitoxin [Flavobacterium psychrophilum]EKT2068229.1 type IV toxin-antitoxin system AbiEi family antitoxin [Flavobacterium psychrophilum]EKT2072414.1 type IV toxin-antitoxin system AbiEi family antitoxin [Flavobacterium psychrophilum]EKT4491906.1 type IV toxin-antitoxin system AbiEi family antitoxin [Flavobacterium psychrophilum]MBF2044105.1 type IV toxin-antitoxin system AbiEi family antitoxin [Flavobacterium psychrophilum]
MKFIPFCKQKLKMRGNYAYLEDFINELRSNGRYAFSLPEVRNQFEQSDEAIKKALQRLKKKKEIALIRNEFYVVITPEYRSKGILPPSLFISELMKFLEKDYYVGLLNAAAYYGAAHQQPQSFSVITMKPSLRNINNDNLKMNFYIKKEWSKSDIVQKKVDTGYINVSSPELTALDLVCYFDQAGGLNRVATVLEELCESIDANKLLDLSKRYSPITAVQRLGFLLEEILDMRDLSDPIKDYLKTVNYFPVLLRPQKEKPEMITGNDWKVVQNLEIETDL